MAQKIYTYDEGRGGAPVVLIRKQTPLSTCTGCFFANKMFSTCLWENPETGKFMYPCESFVPAGMSKRHYIYIRKDESKKSIPTRRRRRAV